MINPKEVKRGISPLIATVLLIAFIIVIGTAVFIWGGDFSKGAISDVQEKDIQMKVMSQGEIKVIGHELMSGNAIKLQIENVGSLVVSGIIASITGTTGNMVVTVEDSLEPLNIKYYTFEYDPDIVGMPTEIKATPIFTYDSNGDVYNTGEIQVTGGGGFIPYSPPSGSEGGSTVGGTETTQIETTSCTSNAECTADEACSSAGLCVEIACFSNLDCVLDEVCKYEGTGDAYCGCNDGALKECGTNVGSCAYGSQVCSSDVWGDCEGAINPEIEICDDGVDNDCNGYIDETCNCATNGEIETTLKNCCSGLTPTVFSEKNIDGVCDDGTPATCDIMAITGTCNSVIPGDIMYYYNTESKACEAVEWLNCYDGIKPPFADLRECESNCIREEICLACGDGYCGIGENVCNCASDCVDKSCNADIDCKVTTTACSCCNKDFGCINVNQEPTNVECSTGTCFAACSKPPACECIKNVCSAKYDLSTGDNIEGTLPILK